MTIKVILLDVGGVIVELAGVEGLVKLIGGGLPHDVVSRLWAESESVKKYESGLCDTSDFIPSFIQEFKLNISPGDFVKEFGLYVRGFFPGAVELLQMLKPRYTLACLSNTSLLHWNSLCERTSIESYLHHVFLSYEMKLLKPDPGAYSYVIDKLGCLPNEIAFFDDNEANVQAGLESGMNAYRVFGAAELKEKLESLGLITQSTIQEE